MGENKVVALLLIAAVLQVIWAGEIRQADQISISPLIEDVQKLKTRVNALHDHLVLLQNNYAVNKKLVASLRVYASTPYREIVNRAIKDVDNLYNQNV